MDDKKLARIRDELIKAGVTKWGLAKLESKELPRIIHDNEHIGGVVYGQISGTSSMLVATDKRVIFIDKRPLFCTVDELTYDVVSGVGVSKGGLFTSVVLHTRVADYAFRYVNSKCANIFMRYIEEKRLKSGSYNHASNRFSEGATSPVFQNITDKAALTFLKNNEIAVLSTVDRTGNLDGAVVYYLLDSNNYLYILTKSETKKGRNVYAHSQVALTIHEPDTLKTLQLQGMAEVETDQTVKDRVFSAIVKPRITKDGTHMPPITTIHEGSFMVIRIEPTNIKYRDYAK